MVIYKKDLDVYGHLNGSTLGGSLGTNNWASKPHGVSLTGEVEYESILTLNGTNRFGT